MATQTLNKIETRQVELRSRPDGVPTEENFGLGVGVIEPPTEGEFLVQNEWMSVDPYMRGRMKDTDSYVEPFQIGKALDGGCIGKVIESRNDRFVVGDYVWDDIDVQRCKAVFGPTESVQDNRQANPHGVDVGR